MIYTLVADGSSDRVLIPILDWSLRQQRITPIQAQWADFSRIRSSNGLQERLTKAIDLYPCDVLFVHRDAEGHPPKLRRLEISTALASLDVRHVPVIPVRMTEAWLLGNELAIRSAAGNPSGTRALNLPALRNLEKLPDPKKALHNALLSASGLGARRRERFRVEERVHNIPNYIDDYSMLSDLPAFAELQQAIRELGRSRPRPKP